MRAVDTWEECLRGADVMVEASRLTEPEPLLKTAWITRERDDERILFWHRGLSIADIALGEAMLAKAGELGIGTTLPYR